MAKKPTAKQLAARKKFVAAVRSGAFKKKKVKQTGTSSLKADKKRKAKPPGKRTVRHGKKRSTVYYEYRKNRSDKPGKLTGVRAKKKRVAKKTTVASLKSKIRVKLDDQLKDQLFKRDKATTYKQHRTAQNKIDTIRKELRKQK